MRDLTRQLALVLLAVALTATLAFIALDLHRTLVDLADYGPSAPQIIQVYTESLYKVVVAIGIGIAAYFAIRALD